MAADTAECATGTVDGKRYPDIDDCRLYHVCFQFFLTTVDCPVGDAYDIYTEHCENATLVDCSLRCLSTAAPETTIRKCRAGGEACQNGFI